MIRPYAQDDLETIADIGNRAWRDIYRMFHQTYGDALFTAIVPDKQKSKGEQIRAHCRQYPEWRIGVTRGIMLSLVVHVQAFFSLP